MSVRNVPCWTPDFSLCSAGPCCPDVANDAANAIVKQIASDLAAQIIWGLTGRRFGCCEVTVRPCKPETKCDGQSLAELIYWDQRNPGGTNMGVLSYFPTLVDGAVFNISCGCKQDCCTCKSDCEVFLPGPVCEVIDVVVGATHLGKNMYSLYDHHKLALRNDGVQVNTPVTLPLPAGFIEVNGSAMALGGCGVELSTVGANYGFTIPDHQDVQFELEMPIGGSHSFNIFQPQNFDVIVLDGGNPTVTVVGSLVTVGPATIPNTAPRVLIRAPRNANSVDFISITQQTGSPIRLCEVQWSDFSTGTGYCPPCQDYNKPLGEPNTWSVTYKIGEPWPPGAEALIGYYACELGKAFLNQDCTLPKNVVSVARRGVDVAFADPFLLAKSGLTGLPILDTWITMHNPTRLANRARAWSPDVDLDVRREH